MKEILDVIQYLQNYIAALEVGVHKFIQALPIYTEQHIRQEANRKLNTTKEQYLSAVSAKIKDYVLIVELDRDNWIANAVETGADAFNMKEGLLNSKKAKRSKKTGFRYISIPISKDKNVPGGTEKSQDYNARLNQILIQPKFGLKQLKSQLDGSVVETQQIQNTDEKMGGLYRTRKHKSAEAFHSGKSRPKWQFVMFRTVSDNPVSKTGAKWDHPGIKPVNIFRSTEQWLNQAVDTMMGSFIQSELDKVRK